jgi:tight adherence protein B
MIGALGAVVGAYGVFLLYTAALGWRGVGVGPSLGARRAHRSRRADWLAQAGLAEVRPLEFAGVVAALTFVGAGVGLVLFGAPVPALVIAAFDGTFPVAWYRDRRQRRRSEAHEAWPRMLEELRLLTGSLGRSVPQALFEVGARGPEELRPAFATAHREWLLSTDFAKTLSVLKKQLADVTADAVAETLLVAHQLGGTDLDHRLSALIDDRTADLQGRKDARAKQAGVRFVRRFVLFVPFGMALIGLSMGEGRSSYETELGQAGVALAVGVVIVCWVWAGHLLRLPEEDRVFPA